MEKASPSGGAKRAEQIADLIEQKIVEERLPAGTNLGGEAELMVRLGVSRAVLREALVLVSSSGLASVRRNRGLVVEPAQRENAAAALLAYLEMTIENTEEIWLLRICVEVLAVTLAVHRADARDIDEIEALTVSMELATTGATIKDLTSAMAHRVFLAAHNTWVSVLSEALSHLTFVHTLRNTAEGAPPFSYTELAALRREQARASISGDLGGAIATTHRVYRLLRSGGDLRDRELAYPNGLLSPSGPLGGARWKLGQSLAEKLRREIAQKGYGEGSSLGAEAELMKTHAVGRATLREAVRLLERMGRAKMVRGRGGGLIVTEPDPQRISRNILIHLRHLGVRKQETIEFSRALFLSIVDTICQLPEARKSSLPTLRTTSSRESTKYGHAAVVRLMQELCKSTGLRGFSLMASLSEALLASDPSVESRFELDCERATIDRLFDCLMHADAVGARIAALRLNRAALDAAG